MRVVVYWATGSIPFRQNHAVANLSSVMKMLVLAAPGSQIITAPIANGSTTDDVLLHAAIRAAANRVGIPHVQKQYRLPADLLNDDLTVKDEDLGWDTMVVLHDGFAHSDNVAGFPIVDVDVTGGSR